MAADALLSMLLPFWQLAIGAVVLAAVIVAGWRLSQRGPSRMSRALVVTGAAIVALTVLGVLLQG
ncbi:MAG TPA: hypothetical protein VFC00_32070 [Micromonosporaceae bacterium]|nr:hypothetical protein [Micromonosporaceae bacterium]